MADLLQLDVAEFSKTGKGSGGNEEPGRARTFSYFAPSENDQLPRV